jgi:hypothetical protein
MPTAVDVVHKLLGFASPDRATQLRHKTEKLLMIAYGRSLGSVYTIGDLAVACLMKICALVRWICLDNLKGGGCRFKERAEGMLRGGGGGGGGSVIMLVVRVQGT